MIKVKIVEPDSPAWTQWKQRCADKTAKTLEQFAKGDNLTVSDLYKAQKSAFVKIYNGKCGWCEKRVSSTQFGDIDHYRPKNGIAEEDWTPVNYERDGRTGPHRGYYWLTYEPENLVYCCISCNQVAQGRLWGKGTRFPVTSFRAEVPGEEVDEQPKLLHPVKDDPATHLGVDRTGVIVPLNQSERGHTTVAVFGLNERGLPTERASKYREIVDKVNHLWNIREEIGSEEAIRRMRSLRNEAQEFEAVVRQAFCDVVMDLQQMAEAAA